MISFCWLIGFACAKLTLLPVCLWFYNTQAQGKEWTEVAMLLGWARILAASCRVAVLPPESGMAQKQSKCNLKHACTYIKGGTIWHSVVDGKVTFLLVFFCGFVVVLRTIRLHKECKCFSKIVASC